MHSKEWIEADCQSIELIIQIQTFPEIVLRFPLPVVYEHQQYENDLDQKCNDVCGLRFDLENDVER